MDTMGKISKLLADTRALTDGYRRQEGVAQWDDDLTLFSMACLIESFGLDELGEALIITPANAAENGVKLGDFFVPPKFIRDAPFPDTLKLWWEAAGDVLKEGKAFDENGKPSYGLVVSVWKNKVEEVYGYRPSASKEKSFAQAIEDGVSQSAKLMAAKRAGKEVDADAVKKASKMMNAKRAAKRLAAASAA